MGRWAVVVPTCRPAEFARFEKAWEPLFTEHEVTVYPVRDDPASWETWPDWVPRQSDMCRSYGFWQAWRDGHEFTLSLDDDVRPYTTSRGEIVIDPFVHYEKAFARDWPCLPYLSVAAFTSQECEMRGFPYENRDARCMVQYGGWDGVLDYDGKTQLNDPEMYAEFDEIVIPVPRGCAVTTCAMNMAFRTEFTPCMWQLPVLGDRYKRWGDIWSGLIQKRVLDARGEVMLVNGRASVLHERMSDPVKNAELEAPGMEVNEGIWDVTSPLPEHNANGLAAHFVWATNDVVEYIGQWDSDYEKHFFAARNEWLALFA